MKFTTYVAIAASLFAVASAVTMTLYSDADCKTAKATSDAAPTPFVTKMGDCTKYGTNYVKAAGCTGTAYVAAMYSEDKCVTPVDAMTGITDKCEAHGSGVYRIVTCASTSSVTMAFLAVAAAVLALSF